MMQTFASSTNGRQLGGRRFDAETEWGFPSPVWMRLDPLERVEQVDLLQYTQT